ncbi:MAG TPA: hypothetical protein ENN13_02385 [Candidatus Altiarchaeales archaeon]|nr:hypothetical protein [Candidatus Altiarchaeales archaeon]
MPYAIPANIKYEEKLLGPFTIKQSIYIGVGALIAGYFWLESDLEPEILRKLIAIVAVGIAFSFAQFRLDEWLAKYISFMRSEKKTSWLSPAARNLMNIQSIRADAVFMKDKRILGVLKITPINFGILGPIDQDTVIYGFLEFLNSLNYPVQIVMKSVNLDLEGYLSHLKRRIVQRDDKVALAYYEHFAEYMRSYIQTNQINDRHFFLIVPAKKQAVEKVTLDYLETQMGEIHSRLSLSGIVSERMSTQQLINFYGSYFTEKFEIYEKYVSPITLYRRMWKTAPKTIEQAEKEMLEKASGGGR